MVVKNALNYIIVNKKHQSQNKKDQFLFYIRKKRDVGKNRIVKVIYLIFSLLKRISELLIVVLIDIIAANI